MWSTASNTLIQLCRVPRPYSVFLTGRPVNGDGGDVVHCSWRGSAHGAGLKGGVCDGVHHLCVDHGDRDVVGHGAQSGVES